MTEEIKPPQYHWEDTEGVCQETYNDSVLRAQRDIDAYLRTAVEHTRKELGLSDTDDSVVYAAPIVAAMIQARATEFQTSALMKQMYHLNCNLDWIGRKLNQIQQHLDGSHD
jgi:hypothetical protein